MKCSIVIPCFNEEANVKHLVDVLDKVRENREIEYILVENGSKDGTRNALERACANRYGFQIAYVDENQGYGYGLQQGLKKATGNWVGWLHADLQVNPSEMMKLVDFLADHSDEKLFLKGRRKNRKAFDVFFTAMMSVFETLLFHTPLTDIGAIPVLFPVELLKGLDKIPYDFSIELFMYLKAKQRGYRVVRLPVVLGIRGKGESSWDKGLQSKIKQSIRIMDDSIKIKRGVQVL